MKDWREDARKRAREKQKRGRFKLREGENTIRILPNKRRFKDGSPRAPYFEYKSHSEVGPNKRFVRCGKNVRDEGDCWLCDKKIPELSGSGIRSKRRRAEAILPKEQMVVQIAHLDPDTNRLIGPVLWAVPGAGGGTRTLAYQLLQTLGSKRRRYDDPAKGYNLNISRTGTGRTDTRYSGIEPDEETTLVPKGIVDKTKFFADLVPKYLEDDQKAAYFGRDREPEAEEPDLEREGVEEDGEEEEARPKKKKKKPAEEEPEEEDGEGKREEEGEEDGEDSGEGDGEDSGEEDGEEDRPKKKKKKRPPSEEEDGEDSGGEEDGEGGDGEDSGEEEGFEGEERPKKKKQSKEEDGEDSGEEDGEGSDGEDSGEEGGGEEPEEEEPPRKKKKFKKKFKKKKHRR